MEVRFVVGFLGGRLGSMAQVGLELIVAQTTLEPAILLPLVLWCWYYWCLPSDLLEVMIPKIE